jgi:hypothetical protein
MMKPSRRTQPYRKKGGLRPPGPARSAMQLGRAAGQRNPMDSRRRMVKGGRLAQRLAQIPVRRKRRR